jgi:para-aminobenzoate synthetase/4-amino-4-deoxychorismate lyase
MGALTIPYVLVRYVAPDGVPVWLEGQCPVGIVEARTHDSVLPALTQVEQATAQGLTAIGFVAYEAAHGLDSAFPHADAPLPLVWFAVYEAVRIYSDPLRASSVNGRSHLHSASTAQSVLLNETPSLRFPLPAGGTTPARFPSRSGGNLKEGGKDTRPHLPADAQLSLPAGGTTPARFPSRSGGNLKEGGKDTRPHLPADAQLSLPAGGTTPARFPSRSGGNLKEGGKIGRWHPTLTRGEYARALCAIHEAIGAGEVYQVNYTFRLRAPFSGDLLPLFWQLYERQPVPYAAYLDTGAHAIASLSPELFFALDGERITTRPMKGTAPRGLTRADDLQQAERLTRCPKNRAENLMIVDMARNDLGRIARIGSVRVPRLFEAERYATLWQMTSTVVACTDAPLPEIFRALFPAASITGAPKIRATHVIHALERAPRGVYTGAIGVVLPDRHAQFNVAIRTLHYDKVAAQLTFGVGSGIVWDSEQVAEYEECLTKAQVLLAPRPEFELLETLLWRRGRGYFLLEAHLKRLRDSADYFGFAVDADAVRHQLLTVAERFTAPRYRVRLRVNRYGEAQVEHASLAPERRVWRVALAHEPVDPREVFLYHKTTHRQVYERARAARPDCDDVILWNTHGEITESTLANVVVRMDGRYYTPPVECGLLAGVYREHLLQRGLLRERVLTIDDLRRAEAVYLINSVRGRIRAEVVR